jgi:hypothetical protein
MKVLSLDLGSHMGWAVGINDKITKHGFCEWARKADADANARTFTNESFSEFLKWLQYASRQVDMIVCEKPNVYGTGKFSSFHAMRVLFGMYGLVQAVCGAKSKSLIPVSATSVKKFWTNKGKANKLDMLQEAAKRGFYSIEDHNECDAVAIYTYYWEELRGKSDEDNDGEATGLAGSCEVWEEPVGTEGVI